MLDLIGATNSIVIHNPQAAKRVGERIRRAADRLADNPRMGRAYSGDHYRKFAVPDTRYVIYYELVDDKAVLVTQVRHSSQRPALPPDP